MKGLRLLNRNTQESILAKITNANYYVLELKNHNNRYARACIKYRDEICFNKKIKALETMSVLEKLTEERSSLINILSNNAGNKKITKKAEKRLKKLNKVLDSNEVDSFYNFCGELSATTNLVNNGKLVDFENFSEYLKSNMSYIFAADVFYNLKPFYDLGDDLSFLYMRSLLTTADMPLFVTKELKEKFDNYVMEKTGRAPVEYSNLTTIPNLRKVYVSDSYKKAKELYESVFPEFGFKYEDANIESNVYIPVWDKSDWDDDLYR